jgi:predicted amino acid racemase
MKKEYPCIEVNLNKVTENTGEIIKICRQKNIQVVGVSKVFCGRLPIVMAMINGGIEIVGDSRIENLKKIQKLKCRKMLLRIPMESHAAEVVRYCDISLNSELDTITKLSEAASKINKLHHIILMIDLGDLREGVLEEDVDSTVNSILKLSNIKLCGLGTNLTCYGGVIPDKINLGKLVQLNDSIKEKYGIELSIISGGNSSSLYAVLDGSIPEGINQLRIGEAIILGRETAFGSEVPNCHNDAFILKGEIIEIKEKPSVPIGEIGVNAFGEIPRFENKGIIKRAIVALGRQDIVPEGMEPLDKNAYILGASSDHLIVDISKSLIAYKVGDVMHFTMSYACLLAAMTSPYVRKYYS